MGCKCSPTGLTGKRPEMNKSERRVHKLSIWSSRNLKRGSGGGRGGNCTSERWRRWKTGSNSFLSPLLFLSTPPSSVTFRVIWNTRSPKASSSCASPSNYRPWQWQQVQIWVVSRPLVYSTLSMRALRCFETTTCISPSPPEHIPTPTNHLWLGTSTSCRQLYQAASNHFCSHLL